MASRIQDSHQALEPIQVMGRAVLPMMVTRGPPVKDKSVESQDSLGHFESPLCDSETCSVTSVSSVIPHRPDSYSSQSEALELLKDRVKKQLPDIRKAFAMFSFKEDSNFILPSHFRLVLDTFCFPLSDAQFRTVLRRCNQSKEGAIDYQEFLVNFAETQWNHQEQTAKGIETSGRSWTLEEVERKLRDQITHRMKPVCLAFRMFDHNQDRKVQCSEMKKIIENFCEMKISEELYQRLWSRYDPTDSGLIEYQEFLKKLALNVSLYQKCLPNLNMKIALTWPDVDIEKYNHHRRRLAILTRADDPNLQGLTLEQIENRIKDKIIKDYALLKRAFLVLDPLGTGIIPYDGFRSTLVHFTHPMSEQLFLQLMQRLGVQPTDRVCWKAFLDQIRGSNQPQHLQRVNITERRTGSRKSTTSAVLSRIVPKLCQLQIRPGIHVSRAFNIKDRVESGEDVFITRQELRMMIERKGNHFSENDIKDLMVTLDPGHTNLISYSNFCNLFGEQRTREEEKAAKDRYALTEHLSYHLKNTRLQPILWEKLVGKLKSKIHKNYETIEKVIVEFHIRKGILSLCHTLSAKSLEKSVELHICDRARFFPKSGITICHTNAYLIGHRLIANEKALGACDYEQKGWIEREQLRQVIHKFCFRLTDDEFERLLQMVDAVDGVVSIRTFLDIFRETEREHLQKWSALVSHLAKPTTPHPWSEQQLKGLLNEVLLNNCQNLLYDFQQRDFQGKGVVTKTDFRTVLYKHIGRLSQSELETLWKKLPIDKHGNLEYVKFIETAEAASERWSGKSQHQDGWKSPGSKTSNDIGDTAQLSPSSNDHHERPIQSGSQMERLVSSLARKSSFPQDVWSKEVPHDSGDRPLTGKLNKKAETDPRPASSYICNPPKLDFQLLRVRPMTGITGAAKADLKMRKVLARRWREIKNECGALDCQNTGLISSDNFLAILTKYGIPVTSGPLLQLLQTKYNLRLDVPVSYINFLRDLFLAIGRKDPDYPFKQQPTKKAFSTETAQLYNILLELRNPVLSRWRSLKKAFRRNDMLGNGSIEVFKFRLVLKDHEIVVPDADFHCLVSYLDSGKRGTIHYKDFLGIFMKTIN